MSWKPTRALPAPSLWSPKSQRPHGPDRHPAHVRRQAAATSTSNASPSPMSASRKSSFPSPCSPRSIPCSARKCAPPVKCSAWPNLRSGLLRSPGGRLSPFPLHGTVFISVADKDKAALLEAAGNFHKLGSASKPPPAPTPSSPQRRHLRTSYKIHEHQRPNIVDEIKSKEINLIINTPIGKTSQFDDAYIRKAAIKYKIPYSPPPPPPAPPSSASPNAPGAGRAAVKSLQSYHQDIC